MQRNDTPFSKRDNIDMTVIPLKGVVIMPFMTVQFDVEGKLYIECLERAMKNDSAVFLTAQKDILEEDISDVSRLYEVGVISEIKQIARGHDGSARVLAQGIQKARLKSLFRMARSISGIVAAEDNYGKENENEDMSAAVRKAKMSFSAYSSMMHGISKRLIYSVMAAKDNIDVFERIVFNINLPFDDRQAILEEYSLYDKLVKLSLVLDKETEMMKLEKDLEERVTQRFERNQKEQYLREMRNAISQELGEITMDDEFDDEDSYVDKIADLGLPQECEDKLLAEFKRMRRMPPSSQEAALISEYLDTCLALPWNKSSDEVCDVNRAREILDRDHYGLKKVKERILENIAVRQLSENNVKGQIICLQGPPGVGKTSIVRSIAEALGRKYVRVSLGGVRDEADIRGHRKTYIGSMPGRIMDALKKCGTNNPVMLLDEIDKLTADAHGDPSSALLEVLDSEQNVAFRDHYIELPFDLSHVLFITTANTLDTIQPPLLDRMEVIELASYTREEKYHIAKEHLIPKQIAANGLKVSQVKLADSAIYALIDYYTREAGVRKLERAIASLCRKAAAVLVSGEKKTVSFTAKNITTYLGAHKYLPDDVGKKDRVGEVNGLAWTSVGGVLMPLEVLVLDGKGTVEATGSLGDVMKESAKIAVSYCRSVAKKYGIDPDFYKNKDIHIHAPEGAVPKDGPSAGVTLATALVSALSNTPVRHDVAMTGEITLTGKVLAIGGLREKSMAAYKDGIKTIIVPKANSGDLDEIDDTVKSGMEFIFAEEIGQVLDTALVFKKEDGKRTPDKKRAAGTKRNSAEEKPAVLKKA